MALKRELMPTVNEYTDNIAKAVCNIYGFGNIKNAIRPIVHEIIKDAFKRAAVEAESFLKDEPTVNLPSLPKSIETLYKRY